MPIDAVVFDWLRNNGPLSEHLEEGLAELLSSEVELEAARLKLSLDSELSLQLMVFDRLVARFVRDELTCLELEEELELLASDQIDAAVRLKLEEDKLALEQVPSGRRALVDLARVLIDFASGGDTQARSLFFRLLNARDDAAARSVVAEALALRGSTLIRSAAQAAEAELNLDAGNVKTPLSMAFGTLRTVDEEVIGWLAEDGPQLIALGNPQRFLLRPPVHHLAQDAAGGENDLSEPFDEVDTGEPVCRVIGDAERLVFLFPEWTRGRSWRLVAVDPRRGGEVGVLDGRIGVPPSDLKEEQREVLSQFPVGFWVDRDETMRSAMSKVRNCSLQLRVGSAAETMPERGAVNG